MFNVQVIVLFSTWEGWMLGNLANILVAAIIGLLQKFVALKGYAQIKKKKSGYNC